MKRLYKIFASWFLCLFLVLSQFIVSFADVNSLMINSGSNALMTLELDDSDYAIMPMSTLGTVTNTLTVGSLNNTICYKNINDLTTYVQDRVASLSSNRYSFYNIGPNNYGIYQFYITLDSSALPPSGKYKFSFDFASDFVLEYNDCFLRGIKYVNNAYFKEYRLSLKDVYSQYSGDIYISPVVIDFRNFDKVELILNLDYTKGFRDIGGSYSVRFVPTSEEAWGTLGDANSSSAYEDGVSSSLSDLSSSVDSMTEDLSSAAENLEYISTSQNLIIQGIDNVVMHISDQLFAFWNQLYNLIHVPTMAKMDDIIDAIRNMDLEIDVNLDGLKQSIHQASQNEIANDNKISADQIANDEANTEEVKEAVKEHGNFIIDGLKGLFIPSDEFFKAYFDDLYAYFSDRFGFLSFPIDLVIRIADLFLTSEKVDAVLTLPSFEISGYKVWEDYSFNFTEFLETSFPFLISAIQTVTSIGLIMAFVNLCQDKWNEVMRS